MSSKRSPLAAIFLTIATDLLGFGLILPLLPLYGEHYGAPRWLIGMLFASFSAMQIVFAPIWGRLSDRHGRRPILLLCLAGTAVSYVMFGLAEFTAEPVLFLFVARAAAGAFAGNITTAQAYIADVTPEGERGRGMALIGAAFGVGFTVGPILGGFGHHLLGWSGPGFIAAGWSTLALLFAWRRLPEPDVHREAPPAGILGFGGLARAFRATGIRVLLLITLIETIAFSIFETTLALVAKSRLDDWNPLRNGLLFAYVGFWLVIAQGWLVRRYMNRVGELRFVPLGCAILGLGLVAVGRAGTLVSLALAAPLAVIGFAMVSPSVASLASQRAPTGARGEILGVNQSTQSLGRIIGPMLGGVLLHRSTALPYWAGAGLMMIALVVALTSLGPAAPRKG